MTAIFSRLTVAFAVLLGLSVGQAHSQYVTYYTPPVFASPAFTSLPVVPSVSYYNPGVVVAPPSVVNYSYYAAPSTVAYASPVMPPSVAYSAPPVVVYSAPPTYVQTPAPGLYTTRTYTGYGIFRPRGTFTDTYYTPVYPR